MKRKYSWLEKQNVLRDLEWAFFNNIGFFRQKTAKQLARLVSRWSRVNYPDMLPDGKNCLIRKIVNWYYPC
jgi:hypothetical protein